VVLDPGVSPGKVGNLAEPRSGVLDLVTASLDPLPARPIIDLLSRESGEPTGQRACPERSRRQLLLILTCHPELSEDPPFVPGVPPNQSAVGAFQLHRLGKSS